MENGEIIVESGMLLCARVIVFLTNVLAKLGAPDLFSSSLLSKSSSQPLNMQARASWALGRRQRTAANLITV